MDQLNNHTRSRHVALDMSSDLPSNVHTRQPPSPVIVGPRTSRRKDSIQHPKPPLTPNTSVPTSMPQTISNPLLPSAPASPPTPAPSPTPHQRSSVWLAPSEDEEDPRLRELKLAFSHLDQAEKFKWLASLIDVCDNHSLSFLHHLISPKLKKDPFKILPNEICFKVSLVSVGKHSFERAEFECLDPRVR